MKILEICLFSAGQDGVFTRVKNESILLAKKGNQVKIFSSKKVKGSRQLAKEHDKIGNVEIYSFSTVKGIFSESFMLWPSAFKKAILDYNPDVIIAHCYRHMHTFLALGAAKQLNCKTFLVTHAPFGRSSSRNIFGKIVVWLYDSFIGPRILKKYNKIITISHWEEPYLAQLGVDKNKIVYIPNGIGEEFFKPTKIKPDKNKIIYTGRIAPIKNLEVASGAIVISGSDLKYEMFGPAEENYKIFLESKIRGTNQRIIDESFNKKQQISKLDSSKFFILPSKSEGMPQSLIEAMARGKICIASENQGSSDIIKNRVNGFLFRNGDVNDLTHLLKKIQSMDKKELNKISKNARKSVEQFKWSRIIDRLARLIREN